jgi:hypothetical protein
LLPPVSGRNAPVKDALEFAVSHGRGCNLKSRSSTTKAAGVDLKPMPDGPLMETDKAYFVFGAVLPATFWFFAATLVAFFCVLVTLAEAGVEVVARAGVATMPRAAMEAISARFIDESP